MIQTGVYHRLPNPMRTTHRHWSRESVHSPCVIGGTKLVRRAVQGNLNVEMLEMGMRVMMSMMLVS
jgi:hypothetical protein